MDFTTEHMDQALSGLGSLTGTDQSALSALPDSAKSEYIATKMGGVMASRDVTRYPDGDLDSATVEKSARTQAKNTLQSALASRKPADANTLRNIGMTHLMWMQKNGLTLPANITFEPSEDDLAVSEVEALDSIVRYYDSGNIIQLQSDFQKASHIQGHAEIRQRAELADATERAADIDYTKQGLQILGYLPKGVAIADITPEQMKSAMGQFMVDGHMGLQSHGTAFEHANLHYNSANIYTMRDAMYARGSSELLDAKMARALVETGLDTSGLPKTLSDGGTGINYSAVHKMAERGGLVPVPDDYLTSDQKAVFDALGGQTSAGGQAYLRDMIAKDDGTWYGRGLKQIAQPVLAPPVADVVRDVAPLTPGHEYPEHIVDSTTVWNAIPSHVPDDLPEEVKGPMETMVGYKNALIDAQRADAAPGGDRGIIRADLYRAEDNMGMIEEQLRANGGWDKVQGHLFNPQASAPAAPAPQENEMQFEQPAGAAIAAKGDRLQPPSAQNVFDAARFGPPAADAPAVADGMDALRKAMEDRTAQQHMTAGM